MRSSERREGWTVVAVITLAGVAAVWAVVGSQVFLPYTSGNPDEAVYLFQSDVLRHGRVFAPAPDSHVDVFQPLFSAHREGRFVPKYSPVHAAILALGWLTFGTPRAGLAFIAVGIVFATYLLAREVLGQRRHALLATVFVVASPLFLVQSATFLSYVSALALLELFAWALLRGLRLERRWWFVLAGALFGTAFFARSYDALLFGLPFAGLFVYSHRRRWRPLVGRAACVAAGTVPLLALYLAFNSVATGHPLRPPFALDPSDSLGFGAHRIVPGDPYYNYTPRTGLIALGRYLTATSFWVFGGIPTAVLAAWFLRRRHVAPPAWALAAVVALVPIGYFFFWGMAVSSIASAGVRYLGPWYYMPLFGPLVILAAGGFAALFRRDRVIASAAALAMAVISGFVTLRALSANAEGAERQRLLHRALADVPANSLVFLPADILLDPFKTAGNPTLDGPVVYAVSTGPARNLDVAAAFPERRPYLVDFERGPDDEDHPPITKLRRLEVVQGEALTIPVSIADPPQGTVLSIEWHGRRLDCELGPEGGTVEIRLSPSGTECTGGPVTAVAAGASELPPEYVFVTITGTTLDRPLYRWTAPVDINRDRLFITPPVEPDLDRIAGGVEGVAPAAVAGSEAS